MLIQWFKPVNKLLFIIESAVFLRILSCKRFHSVINAPLRESAGTRWFSASAELHFSGRLRTKIRYGITKTVCERTPRRLPGTGEGRRQSKSRLVPSAMVGTVWKTRAHRSARRAGEISVDRPALQRRIMYQDLLWRHQDGMRTSAKTFTGDRRRASPIRRPLSTQRKV